MTAIDEIYRRLNDDTEAPDIDWTESKIQPFFAGKTVLLSGATGYMGKVFVEKILRDCPDLKCLYVLVRYKKGVSPQEKMKKYFQDLIFDNLRAKYPNFEEKVCTVTGDLQEDRLGLSDEDRRTLTETVDIIVHNGATTKFDEKVSISLKINALGTKNMLDLAMECKHIQVFVYISTAYSHCYQKNIKETFYDSPADLKMVYDIIASDEATEQGLSEDAINMLIGKFPNVYCFSKAIAEGFVKQYGDKANFAVGLYRPTVVGAAVKEPSPGWVGNNNGPALMFVGVAMGVLHAVYYEGHPIDLIPVDFSINSIIAVIYDLAIQWEVVRQPTVYNYGSSTLNPVRFSSLYSVLKKEGPNQGSSYSFWVPSLSFCEWKWQFWIMHILTHFIPAILGDIALLCLRKKPRALKLFFFGTKHLNKIDYFANGNWRIHSRRTMEMHDRLTKADQTIFFFDIRNVHWDWIAYIWLRGGRVHITKESFDTPVLEKTRKIFARMLILHYITLSVIYSLVAYFAMKLLL